MGSLDEIKRTVTVLGHARKVRLPRPLRSILILDFILVLSICLFSQLSRVACRAGSHRTMSRAGFQ